MRRSDREAPRSKRAAPGRLRLRSSTTELRLQLRMQERRNARGEQRRIDVGRPRNIEIGESHDPRGRSAAGAAAIAAGEIA
jgi:hypothetical protein